MTSRCRARLAVAAFACVAVLPLAALAAVLGCPVFSCTVNSDQRPGDIKKIQVETDPKARQALISDALGVIKNQFLYIPLHQQVVVWAARSNVDVAQMADNYFYLRFVTVK